MDAYVAAVQYCNGKLDDYNAAFAQYQDLRGERDKVTLEIDTTQGFWRAPPSRICRP
jgi:hypothetical protein